MVLRKNLWKAMLKHPEAEQDYLNIVKNNRAFAVSKNEVRITR